MDRERNLRKVAKVAVPLALVTGLTVAPTQEAEASEPRTITVSATGGDTYTGHKLHAGQLVRIKYIEGGWTMDKRRKDLKAVGPQGYTSVEDATINGGSQNCKIVPEATAGVMLMRVGKQEDPSNYVPVGTGGIISSPGEGAAYLLPNDGPACRNDNANREERRGRNVIRIPVRVIFEPHGGKRNSRN